MNQFKPSMLTLALFAAGMTYNPAMYAQTEQAEETATTVAAKEAATDAQSTDEKKVESIQIRGFRGSVVKSLNTKRYSDTVVDAISADDIGGLPDVSIADALVRMPGITSIRIDGQSSELNIRGLSGGFVFSTLNGREQVSASGGRSVQFDQYPSELITQAQIYKSQKASLIEGGVAGTIELQTANALNNEEDQLIRLSAHGNWNEAAAENDESPAFGHRLTASYQKKLLDETVGVSLGYARMYQPTISSRWVNYKFDEMKDFSDSYDGAPDTLYVSDGFEINERRGEDTRNAYIAAFNWSPSSSFQLQTDIFYSDFDSTKIDRGLRVSGLKNITKGDIGLRLTNPIIAGNTLVGGTFTRDPNHTEQSPTLNPRQVFDMNVQTQADDNSTNSKVFSWGIKADWEISDRLTMTVDASHSDAKEVYQDRVIRMAMFEDANAATPLLEDDLQMTYHLNSLGVPNVSFNQDFTDMNKMMVASAEAYPHIEENSADALRLDFKYSLDSEIFSGFETGFRVSNRQYEKNRGRFLYGTTDNRMRNGQYITYEGLDENGNPIEIERFAPFRLTDEFASPSSMSGDLANMPGFLSINNDQVLDAWIPNVNQTPVKLWAHNWTMTQNNVIEEDVWAGYFQANLDTEMFGLPMTGNLGLRIVHSDQKSTGLIFAGSGVGETITDDVGATNSDWVFGTEGIKYTDYLPSMNLNFALTANDQLRFAVAKVMSRPDMDKMANSGAFDFSSNSEGFFVNFSASTSPYLRPFYANQYDISYEHYLEDGQGAFVVALWNKDITNFVPKNAVEHKYFDFAAAGIELPEPPEDKKYDNEGNLIDFQNGSYSQIENVADAGYMRGIEIAYTQTFTFLPDLWKGLGVNVNYSYTQSEIKMESSIPGNVDINGDPNLTPIPGLSERVYSGTIFYDYNEIFSARMSVRYRSAYISDQIAIGSNEEAYFADETILSAQVSYNFNENLQAILSIDNFTDEPNASFFRSATDTGTIQYFGRTVYFGVNYKM